MSTGHKNEARSFLLSSLASFDLFDVLRFSLDWFSFSKKGDAVLVQTGLRFFDLGEKELHHCKAHAYETIWVFEHSRLLVLILDYAWPVWSGFEMKCLCCITGTTIIYSVHGHEF